MPRYYFDVHNVKGPHRDDIGDNLRDFEEARQQAQALLADIIRDELPDGELHEAACDVRDETDRVVYQGRLTYHGKSL